MQETTIDIKQLFAKIAKGEKTAFNALFQMQYKRLLSFAMNYMTASTLAEEIISDVFIWIWMNRETLNSIEEPKVYLFVMVKNRCLNALRNAQKFESFEDQLNTFDAKYENPQQNLEYNELLNNLSLLIENLPLQQKQIFCMIKENGLSAKQVAEILNISPRTVETHLYKAVKKLEEEITRYLGYSPKRKQMNTILSLLW